MSGTSQKAYEVRDANLRAVITFGIVVGLTLIASFLISRVAFRYFVAHESLGPPASPLTKGRTLPPAPRLQVNARQDWLNYRAAQRKQLNTYGWVSRDAGIVHIPIDRAMDLLLKRGLPVRPGGLQGVNEEMARGGAGAEPRRAPSGTQAVAPAAARLRERGTRQTVRIGR